VAAAAASGSNRRLAAAATISADDARALDIEACVRRREEGAALGMTLLEIGMFTGFASEAGAYTRPSFGST
jgi:hypothetical protein